MTVWELRNRMRGNTMVQQMQRQRDSYSILGDKGLRYMSTYYYYTSTPRFTFYELIMKVLQLRDLDVHQSRPGIVAGYSGSIA